jgi:hypothetical protein
LDDGVITSARVGEWNIGVEERKKGRKHWLEVMPRHQIDGMKTAGDDSARWCLADVWLM